MAGTLANIIYEKIKKSIEKGLLSAMPREDPELIVSAALVCS